MVIFPFKQLKFTKEILVPIIRIITIMTIINNDKPKRPDIIGRKEEWAALKRRNMIKQRSANSVFSLLYK